MNITRKTLLVILFLFLIPALAFSQRNRAVELIGGIAVNDGTAGFNLHADVGPQWKHFGFASYTSFLSNPSIEFSNWTILGLQLKVIGGEGDLRPYGLFDFGLFNFQTIKEKVNMRTASLDLGGGVDKGLKNGNGLLIDARFKWLVDYAGKNDAFRIFTLGVGLRF